MPDDLPSPHKPAAIKAARQQARAAAVSTFHAALARTHERMLEGINQVLDELMRKNAQRPGDATQCQRLRCQRSGFCRAPRSCSGPPLGKKAALTQFRSQLKSRITASVMKELARKRLAP